MSFWISSREFNSIQQTFIDLAQRGSQSRRRQALQELTSIQYDQIATDQYTGMGPGQKLRFALYLPLTGTVPGTLYLERYLKQENELGDQCPRLKNLGAS